MVRFWIAFAFILAATGLSVLLLNRLGTAAAAGIFGAGVAVFVLGLVWAERAQGVSPGRLTVHFGVSKRTQPPLSELIEASADPSLCRLRRARRMRTPPGWHGLELAEDDQADRARLARTIEWLSANSTGELTFELTTENGDPAHEIEIRASELAGRVAAGQAAAEVRYVVRRAGG
jgi:hypothetical protein